MTDGVDETGDAPAAPGRVPAGVLGGVPGRVAAALGAGGAVAHVVLAAVHAGHAPVLMAGMLLLTLVCARCSLALWRRPGDPVAWRDLLVLGALMALLHLATGIAPVAVLVLPVAQAALAVLAWNPPGSRRVRDPAVAGLPARRQPR